VQVAPKGSEDFAKPEARYEERLPAIREAEQ